MNITVYLGALEGNDPALGDAVRELGTWIGESGNSLIYGGSKSGLMGQIAESVLNAGGKVTGVEPQFFIDSELQYDEITELIVTKDMAERKAKMIELGDAFIAFPGGTGTLEEIAEVMSMVSLKHLNAPCILYNLNGYYDSLKQLHDHMVKTGLSSSRRQEGIYFADNLEDIKALLPEYVLKYNEGTGKHKRLLSLSVNMCNSTDYFRIDSTRFLASAVSSLILSNAPAFTRSPFTIQLPPQHIILSKER